MRSIRLLLPVAAVLAALSLIPPDAVAVPGAGSNSGSSGPGVHPDNYALECPDLLKIGRAHV